MVADQFESQLLLVGMWVSKVVSFFIIHSFSGEFGSFIHFLGNFATEANVEEIESSGF